MQTDMPLLKNGKTLFLVLALSLSACRSSAPPKIRIWIGDGFGGADGVVPSGMKIPDGCWAKDPAKPTQVYCPPSALVNFWMTTEEDQKAYSSWCYDVSLNTVDPAMRAIYQEAKR